MAKTIWLLLAALLSVTAAFAQDSGDFPNDQDIFYDLEVSETITDSAFYDWWRLEAEEGDIIVAQMQGADGLAPLIGILDTGGDLAARSPDGAVNGKVEVEYTAQASGPHRIVATRVGNQNGATTGAYTLIVRRGNPPQSRDNPYQDVTFRCRDFEVTTAATLVLEDDSATAETYRISIYGLDGFSPVIRVHLGIPDFTDCSQDARAMGGDVFTLPGEEARALPEQPPDRPTGEAAQFTVKSAAAMGAVTLTIGSKDGQPGRYLAVIEGFSIAVPRDRDAISVRLGPLAKDTAMLVYMVGGEATRLDPFLSVESDDPAAPGPACDDAGRRGCADTPAIVGAGVKFNDGVKVVGDRFDAGLRLAPGHPDPITLIASSSQGSTQGAYALVVIGELPPKPGP